MKQNFVEKEFQEIEMELNKEPSSLSYNDLVSTINKWLLIRDTGLIKVITATVLANRLNADPVWLFIVTASGGAKTELIMGLNKIDQIYPLSDLTTQTFLSGDKNKKDASLLFQLKENTILTFKDFTTVLTMHRDKRHAILSQLREIYDGFYKKPFGTGETKEWKGKIGFIAGVTPVIETHSSVHSSLGERFIQYRPIHPDSIDLARRAMSNNGKEKKMREEIQNAFKNYVTGIQLPTESFSLPEEIKEKIANLSSFCVKARSGVLRDGYSTREIEYIPDSELPTRLAKQLATLAFAFSLIDGDFTKESYDLICKIGMDTIPQRRKAALDVLLKRTDYLESSDVALKIGYPTNTTRRILEELYGLRVINREHQGQGHADKWIVNEKTKELLTNAGYSYETP